MIKLLKSNRFVFSVFLSLFVIGIVTHVVTLTYSPLPWLDEVEIAEMVRDGIVHAPSDHGLHYYCRNELLNSQSWAMFYVGGWIQNAFYEMFGSSGPRISSLLGLVLLSAVGFFYARQKTGSIKFAALFGTILSSFPLFVQSARGARVDVWAIALLLLALLLSEMCSNRKGKVRALIPILIGVIGCLSVFTWVSSALFAPIYLWSLLEFSRHDRKWLRTLGLAVLGGTLALAVLLLPFLRAEGAIENFIHVLTTVSGASNQNASCMKAARLFLVYLITPPFVLSFGLCLLVPSRRSRILLVGAVLMFVIIVFVCARVYDYRMVYFMPYALLGFCLFHSEASRGHHAFMMLTGCVALACYARGVVIRNGIEYLAKDGRAKAVVQAALERRIGRAASIYCHTHQLYYIGRELHWRQFAFVEGFHAEELERCRVEWFIGEEKDTSSEMVAALKNAGFVQEEPISFDIPPVSPIADKLLTLASRTRCYGPYVVFRKPRTR